MKELQWLYDAFHTCITDVHSSLDLITSTTYFNNTAGWELQAA